MLISHFPGYVEALAPAKLNLFLEVVCRRDDGFHEIETVIVAISIFDTIRFSPTEEPEIELTSVSAMGRVAQARASGKTEALMGDVPSGTQNLVYQAVERLRRRAGERRGATIQLVKRIPSAAGMGGASSDAACAMLAANDAWGLGWTRGELSELAAELGSDVPFFLGTQAAICRGRGEKIEPISGPTSLPLVVVRPPEGLPTALVYKHCSPATRRVTAEPLVSAFRKGDLQQISQNLTNGLQPAATTLSPWISRLHDEFNRLDCLGHQMSGSGTSYFGICRHFRHARRMAARLRSAKLGYVAVANTISTPRLFPKTASDLQGEPHGYHRGSHQAHGRL